MGRLFYNAVNMSVTGGVIIIAVMLLRILFKKLPRKYSYGLWVIPAVRLLCPVAVSSAVSVFNLFNIFGANVNENRMEYIPSASASSAVYREDMTAGDGENGVNRASEENITENGGSEGAADSVGRVNGNEIPGDGDMQRGENEGSNGVKGKEWGLGDIAAVIWLIGAGCVLVWTGASWENVRRRVKNAEDGEGMYICDNIETPFVFGIIRPKIYVPRNLSGEDLRCVMAHERTHIKRGDHIVKLLCIPITAVHWFNPLVWIGCRLMTDDMELSCDERALAELGNEEKKAYANALLNMSVKQNRLFLGGALSFGESGIKGRIKGILGAKSPKKAAVIGAAAVIAVSGVCLLTNAKGGGVINLGSYENIRLVSAEGAEWYSSAEIEGLIEAVDGIEPVRVGAPENAPQEFLFSLSFYKGSLAVAAPDTARFYKSETEEGGDEYYIQLQKSVHDPKYSYYMISEEEFERVCEKFSEYAVHSFTAVVTGAADMEYTLVPSSDGEPYMFFDFSTLSYNASPEVFGEGESITVKAKGNFDPGERVRVTYYGNDMENAVLERIEDTR
ncbi:MAG: M56 family metallopeptidase, partial [Ruminococcus sp.]|nr:M56 family metallopeptidase [Ruminococcus sp.]